MTKTCTRCGLDKPAVEFGLHPKNKSGLQSRCRKCCAEAAARRRREDPEKQKEASRRQRERTGYKMNAATRAWRAKNRDYVRAKKQEWAAANLSAVQRMEDRRRAKRVGLSLEQYDEMYARQGPNCAICGEHESTRKRRMAIDHDHATGAVRELLCTNCNAMIGHAGDDISVLAAGINYLLRHAALPKARREKKSS